MSKDKALKRKIGNEVGQPKHVNQGKVNQETARRMKGKASSMSQLNKNC